MMFDFIFGVFGSLGGIFSSSMDAFEQEIEHNIGYLKKEKWFQEYVEHDIYHQLIADNKEVRRIIGLINTQKMGTLKYYQKKQQKVERVIRKKARKYM